MEGAPAKICSKEASMKASVDQNMVAQLYHADYLLIFNIACLREIKVLVQEDSSNPLISQESLHLLSSSVQVYEQLFTDATSERINDLFSQLDENHTGYIDYLEWSKRVDLKDVPKMIKNCRTQGPLFQSSLTEDEFRQLRRMMRRLHDLADAASQV